MYTVSDFSTALLTRPSHRGHVSQSNWRESLLYLAVLTGSRSVVSHISQRSPPLFGPAPHLACHFPAAPVAARHTGQNIYWSLILSQHTTLPDSPTKWLGAPHHPVAKSQRNHSNSRITWHSANVKITNMAALPFIWLAHLIKLWMKWFPQLSYVFADKISCNEVVDIWICYKYYCRA